MHASLHKVGMAWERHQEHPEPAGAYVMGKVSIHDYDEVTSCIFQAVDVSRACSTRCAEKLASNTEGLFLHGMRDARC